MLKRSILEIDMRVLCQEAEADENSVEVDSEFPCIHQIELISLSAAQTARGSDSWSAAIEERKIFQNHPFDHHLQVKEGPGRRIVEYLDSLLVQVLSGSDQPTSQCSLKRETNLHFLPSGLTLIRPAM